MKIPYEHTSIPPERTKGDIEKLLRDHGISDIQWTSYQGKTTLRFLWKMNLKGVEKEIMFSFEPPIIPARRKTWRENKYEKITVNLEATSYRLLWHYLKNKLEAVTWGLVDMEKEFLSQAVMKLPDGTATTVGEHIEEVYEMVRAPSLEYEPHKKDQDKIIDAGGERKL